MRTPGEQTPGRSATRTCEPRLGQVARNSIFHELANTVARESLSFVRGGSGGRSGPYEIAQAALAALPLPQEGGSVPASEAISMAVSQVSSRVPYALTTE